MITAKISRSKVAGNHRRLRGTERKIDYTKIERACGLFSHKKIDAIKLQKKIRSNWQ